MGGRSLFERGMQNKYTIKEGFETNYENMEGYETKHLYFKIIKIIQ